MSVETLVEGSDNRRLSLPSCKCTVNEYPYGSSKYYKGDGTCRDHVHLTFCTECGQIWLAWPMNAWQKVNINFGGNPHYERKVLDKSVWVSLKQFLGVR